MGCGLRLGGGELLEAVLVDGLDHARIAFGDHMPAHHDVDAVDAQVFEDARVMGDDHQRAVAAAAVGLHAAGHDAEGVDVETGVGFVEDGELRLKEQELEHLDLLLLAGREGADLKGKQFRKLLKDLCEELDMDPAWLDRELGVGFSGGEKKKVEMLQLLLLRPKLAILDETDSGLDVDALSIVSRGIEAYRSECDGALLMITHNTRILERLDVDRTHVMVRGRLVAEGPASLIEEIDSNGFARFESEQIAEA